MVPPTSRIRWFFLASAVLSIAVAWGLALPLLGAAVLAFVSERPIDFILEKSSPLNIIMKKYSLGTKSNPVNFYSGLSLVASLLKHVPFE